MKKRIASLFTSLLMIVSLMVVMPTMSVSATQSKINNFNKSYTLTGNAQNDMVAIAKAQIGMTQSQLGYTEQWCADFVSDCARLANQSIAIPANGSCYSLMNAVKNAGGHTVSKSEALPGDLVFFSSSSNPNGGAHVELVYGYSNGVLKSIGGNCHIDGVSKVYDRSNGKSSSVSYYCVIRPNYTSLLPGKSTINVKPGTSYKCTTFNWTASSNTKVYSIKIHKNGTLFKENTTAATSWSVILPVGDYEAYVDSCNDSGYTCSNTVKFTIEKGNPVPSSTTVSASAGTNYTPTSISWLKTANTNEYDVKIWRGTAQKGEAYKILWGEKGTSCLVDLPAGYYEAYVDSRNDYECSMSANIVKFTVTDGNYLDIGDDFYASLLIYKNWLNVTNVNGSITVQKSENASARQIWFFDRQSDGSYTIKNCADGSYLDSCSPNGGLAQSKKYSGSNTQKWYIFGRWSGEYYFKPKSVNIVLDVKGNITTGDKVQVCGLNYRDSQKFAIYKLDSYILPSKINLNSGSATIEAGTTKSLTATILPTNSTNKTIIWSTSDASIATVSGGTVTGKKAGTVTITAKTTNGLTANAQVKVVAGHTFGTWTTTKNATCTQVGTKSRKCTVCGKTETQTIAKTGHKSVTDKAIPATCTTDGKTEGSHCSVCGAVIKAQDTIKATGHRFGNWTTTESATCTESGTQIRKCETCGATESKSLSAKGHTEVVDKAIPATCTTDGKTEGSHCSVCNTVIKVQTVINATGHKSSGWIVDKAASIGVKGSKHKECTVCKKVLETAEIPALPMINIQSANVSVSTNSYVFDNTAKKPSVTVKIGGKALKNGSDYTVSYLNNTKVGTATVRITGKGDYTGTITRNFTINPAKQQIQKLETRYKGFFVDWAQKGSATGYDVEYSVNANMNGAASRHLTANKPDTLTVSGLAGGKVYYVRVRSYTNTNGKVYYGAWSDVKSIKTANNDITKATVSGISTKAFTGKAITQNVTVKVGNTVLKNGTDYTVSYSNNKKVGKATVKITGKGKYGGVITKTFKINPAKQQIQKLTAKSKAFFVDWAQKGSATGYEIQYATNSKFTGAKKVTITNNKTDKTTVSKLSANKKYYVRVRSYTTVKGTKYYGAWSATKSVTTKK